MYQFIFLIAMLLFAVTIAFFDRYRKQKKNVPSKNLAIVITGCDSGLGYFCAVECIKQGFTVIVTVVSKTSQGARDLQNICGTKNFIMLEMNLMLESSILDTARIISHFLTNNNLNLYAMVNNAGVMCIGEFEWQLTNCIKEQVQVNLLGPLILTKTLMPLIRSHKCRIINVASHCSLKALPGFSVYSATKAAVRFWTNALRIELRKFDVNVISFIPGSFVKCSNISNRTAIWSGEMKNQLTEEQLLTYGSYFNRYYNYLSQIWEYNAPVDIDFDRVIIDQFMKALMEAFPKQMYKVEPFRYKVYFLLFKICPFVVLDDWLINNFVSMPKFKNEKWTNKE